MRRYPIQRSITLHRYTATVYDEATGEVNNTELTACEPLTFKELSKRYSQSNQKLVKLILDRTETQLRGMTKTEFFTASHPYDENEKPVIINLKKELK